MEVVLMTMNAKYISVRDLLDILDGRLSRNAIYAGIAEGKIPHIRIGRRILLPSDCLDRMVSGGESSGRATDE